MPAAIAFALGVGVAPPGSALWALLLALGSVAAVVGLAARRRLLAALLLPLSFFFAGWTAGALDRPPTETISDVFGGQLPEARVVVEGLVLSAPERSERGDRFDLEVVGVGPGPVPPRLSPATARLRLFVAHGDRGAGGPELEAPCGRPGDRVRAYVRLRAPRPREHPGGFSARDWAHRRGHALEAFASGPDRCVRVAARDDGALRLLLEDLRLEAHAAIDRVLPTGSRGLVRALSTGDRSALTPLDRDAIRDAGLAHLTAVSGFHLGVVAWLWLSGLGALFRRIPRISEGFGARRAAALAALPVVGLYPLFVGATPSAVRAGLMLGTVLLAHLAQRGREVWSALAAALLVMAGSDPASLGDPGLQLSFSAVASLLVLPAAFERALGLSTAGWPGPLRFAWTALLGSLAATVGTAPLVALHFGRLSLIGLLANVPAALIAGLAVPLSLLGGLLGALVPVVGAPVLRLAGAVADGLLLLASASASLPGAVATLPPPSALELATYYFFLGALAVPAGSRRLRRAGWAAAAVFAALVAAVPLGRALSTETRVTFLPVGQGDGAVVELPGGTVVVIDAGPSGLGADAGARVIAPFLRHRRIGRVHLFVATHPHADHIGGITGLLEAVPVDRVWWSGDRREGPEEALLALARLEGDPLRPGLRLEAGAAVLELLAPTAPPDAYPSVNDASVVVRLRHGERTLLFTGDAEADGESRLLARYGRAPLRADVLKAGHHGSRTSSTRAFLEAVDPEHVVISCARGNGFGFPHREALERLRQTRARLWRTDLQGAITVVTDGRRLDISGYLPSE